MPARAEHARLSSGALTKGPLIQRGRDAAGPGPGRAPEQLEEGRSEALRSAGTEASCLGTRAHPEALRRSRPTVAGEARSHGVRHADSGRPVVGHGPGNPAYQRASLTRTRLASAAQPRRACRARMGRSTCSSALRAQRPAVPRLRHRGPRVRAGDVPVVSVRDAGPVQLQGPRAVPVVRWRADGGGCGGSGGPHPADWWPTTGSGRCSGRPFFSPC